MSHQPSSFSPRLDFVKLLCILLLFSAETIYSFPNYFCKFQGNRVIKDFDIRKEAGGVSFRAVQKEFKAHVSQNYLEIHLFWAGKGTCYIPMPGTYGPSISAISVTPGNNIVYTLLEAISVWFSSF